MGSSPALGGFLFGLTSEVFQISLRMVGYCPFIMLNCVCLFFQEHNEPGDVIIIEKDSYMSIMKDNLGIQFYG